MAVIGQMPTFAIPPDRSFKGLFDSETCRTAYENTLAKADLETGSVEGRQGAGQQQFNRYRIQWPLSPVD